MPQHPSYTYDHANRLASASISGMPPMSFRYNGLGDRLEQSVDMLPTEYTLDLAGGLTQVLADGTNNYLYGNGRIAQYSMWMSEEYFLGDALGSVRQLAEHSGSVTLAKGYQPYGEVLDSAGNGTTSYGFTGEWTDNTGMVYLRARYYSPVQGRFMTKDSWEGDYGQPVTSNKYNYALSNPIIYTDPSGQNPLLIALLPSIIGAAAGFGTGVVAGSIFGACTYDWALAGQCGCDMQQQASSMTRWEWIGAHALGAGLIGGVAGAIASAAPIGLIVVGVAGIVASGVDIYHTYEIIKNETGITACTVTRVIIDVVGVVFSGIGIAKGVQQWRASGSILRWGPTTLNPPTGGQTAPRAPTSWQDAEGLVKQALGIDKNRNVYRFPGMTQGGKPDFVGSNYIVEVKWYNSGSVSLSEQFRNYIIISENLVKPLWLYVRQYTHVSQPLRVALQRTGGGVVEFFP
jgi:RHS repeat-associated protein